MLLGNFLWNICHLYTYYSLSMKNKIQEKNCKCSLTINLTVERMRRDDSEAIKIIIEMNVECKKT